MKLKLQAIAALILTVLALWFATPASADVISDADAAFDPWSIESIRQEGSTLIVSLDQAQITEDLYKSVIWDGLCYVVRGADQAKFSGINQFKILNKSNQQGYRFEASAKACYELAKFSGNKRDWELFGKSYTVSEDL